MGVQMEFSSKCPDLWFGAFWAFSKGVLFILYYLSLDVTLDIAVMADSDATLDCQRCPKSPFCSCSVNLGILSGGEANI